MPEAAGCDVAMWISRGGRGWVGVVVGRGRRHGHSEAHRAGGGLSSPTRGDPQAGRLALKIQPKFPAKACSHSPGPGQ
jgi:hypothetical protein